MRNLALTLMLLIPALSPAQEPLTDADEIVRRANLAAYYAGADGRSDARMIITDAQGREQLRQFVVLRRDREDGGDQDFLVFFSRPSDVRGTVFLVKKHPDRDDDRWLYLPGLDLVKRIAAGDKRTSFVGSHFFYEDVSGRNPNADTHELVETTDREYVLVHRPKDAGAVEFSEYTTWIDRETFLPMKIEYRNDRGQTYRRVEVVEVQEIEGHPTVVRSQISNLESGGRTRMEFRFIAYDIGIPEDVFSERSLRSPPREWLERPEG
ncbi:MAG: outer membrane lipoprotein-sorting protein [Xanthomonadales bacterium]|nr:outer membrane lipoprotein-sorting protein [Xanthomonadales bacterium]